MSNIEANGCRRPDFGCIDDHTTIIPFELRDSTAMFQLILGNRAHLDRWLRWSQLGPIGIRCHEDDRLVPDKEIGRAPVSTAASGLTGSLLGYRLP